MIEKHEIINDFSLDAVKDKFKPPKMGEIRDEEVIELFERLEINFEFFKDYIYKHSEYYTDNGHAFYTIKDIAKVIRHLFNIENIKK